MPDADFGIVNSASRTRRQMVQRMGRILRKKNNDRSACIAIMYVVDSSAFRPLPDRISTFL